MNVSREAGRRIPMIRDVMTSFLITVPSDASLARAARLIACYHVSGLPVVDADGRAVGVISQTDLLRSAIDDRPGAQHWRYRKVRDAMTSPPLTIDEYAALDTAGGKMEQHRVHRLLVIDDRGRPRGVVSRSDLAWALTTTGTSSSSK
jgi:CBS domain-containing protein